MSTSAVPARTGSGPQPPQNKPMHMQSTASGSASGRRRRPVPPTSTVSGMTRSHVSTTSRIKRVGSAARTATARSRSPAARPLQLLDSDGNDVTPKSLVDPSQRRTLAEFKAERKFAAADHSFAQHSFLDLGGDTRTTRDGGTMQPFSKMQSGSVAGGVSMADEFEVAPPEETQLIAGMDEVQIRHREQVREELSEQDLNAHVKITLEETDTIFMLDIPSVWVMPDTDEATAAKEAAARYAEKLKLAETSKDSFGERAAQTINNAPKTKDVQVSRVPTAAAECQVSDHDLYDTFAALKVDDESLKRMSATDIALRATERFISGRAAAKARTAEAGVGTDDGEGSAADEGATGGGNDDDHDDGPSLAKPTKIYQDPLAKGAAAQQTKTVAMGFGVHRHASSAAGEDAQAAAAAASTWETVKAAKSFLPHLRLIERLITNNIHQRALLTYCGLDPAKLLEDAVAESAPGAAQGAEAAQETTVSVAEGSAEAGSSADGDTDGASGAGEADASSTTTTATAATTTTTTVASSLDDSDAQPALRTLWSYSCALTSGRTVTCLGWNPENQETMAVGYGNLDFNSEPSADGLACCWSLKNPEYPERVYHTDAGVTAVAFSQDHPNLLAIGLYSGAILICDVSSASGKPVVNTHDKDIASKHTQPVWDLKWVRRERASGEQRGEVLVSVSTDGRVMQWLLQKGLDQTDLMRVKRVTNEANSMSKGVHYGNAQAAFIARQAGVMCFAFSPADSNSYVIGTEDGSIHECSCSYNEQFLGNHFGHTGPVYRLEWSPFARNLFLSCSADWSIRIWDSEAEDARTVLQYATTPIVDAKWSPHSPTVLASVSDGCLAVWDLDIKPLDPIITLETAATGIKLTCVSFSPTSNAVVTGDRNGSVTVNMLLNMGDVSALSKEEQAQKIVDIVSRDQQ